MFFFPYRADLQLQRIPWVTWLICVLCLLVYSSQHNNLQQVVKSSRTFCHQALPEMVHYVLQHRGEKDQAEACYQHMWRLHFSPDQASYIHDLARSGDFLRQDSYQHAVAALHDLFEDFEIQVPALQTEALWYKPDSWDPVTMVTSTFAHASIGHLLGNLFFFFAFAATLEVVLGTVHFIGITLWLIFGTSIAYSLAMLAVPTPPATVGLSGVIMGMMGLFMYLLPKVRIRCFFWFFLIAERLHLQAWILVSLFLAMDVASLAFSVQRSDTNLIAHISGAFIGFGSGWFFFRHLKACVILRPGTPDNEYVEVNLDDIESQPMADDDADHIDWPGHK